MKLRLLVSRADARTAYAPGDEIDVPAAEARRMIDAGQAVPVRAGKAERAIATPAAEKAVR